MSGSLLISRLPKVAKRDWLHLLRGPADIAAMRAVKRALDPRGLLNPGVLLPDALA